MLAAVLLLAVFTGLPAASGRASRATVEQRLRSHDVPPAGAWNGLGSAVDEALAEVARDEKVEALIRARALTALGYFPTAASRGCLAETIDRKAASSAAPDRLLVRRAAVAMGWQGGRDVPARLGPLLDNGDPEVRLDAAIGLGLTRLSTAADLLRRRFVTETDAKVRTQIGRQVRAIEDALATPPRK